MSQKSMICKLVVVLTVGLSTGWASASSSSSSILSRDGDGEIITRPREGAPEGIPRMPSGVSIEAYYDANLASVCAYLSNAGDSVEVEFNNLTTEEYYFYEIPGSGLSIMPIGGNPGHWTVSFTLLSGVIYDGDFYL